MPSTWSRCPPEPPSSSGVRRARLSSSCRRAILSPGRRLGTRSGAARRSSTRVRPTMRPTWSSGTGTLSASWPSCMTNRGKPRRRRTRTANYGSCPSSTSGTSSRWPPRPSSRSSAISSAPCRSSSQRSTPRCSPCSRASWRRWLSRKTRWSVRRARTWVVFSSSWRGGASCRQRAMVAECTRRATGSGRGRCWRTAQRPRRSSSPRTPPSFWSWTRRATASCATLSGSWSTRHCQSPRCGGSK
mmetsp:Transcript_132875/g.384169  ORF Transcript_132875/g.384169 Transcript_132875/m.384169 type:complete len:244 (+) Transcript_132875:704-1435(+)